MKMFLKFLTITLVVMLLMPVALMEDSNPVMEEIQDSVPVESVPSDSVDTEDGSYQVITENAGDESESDQSHAEVSVESSDVEPDVIPEAIDESVSEDTMDLEAPLDDIEYDLDDVKYNLDDVALLEADEISENPVEDYFYPAEYITDSDALFSGYVQTMFGINTGVLFESRNLGGTLEGEAAGFYNAMKQWATQVAAGEIASSVFTYYDNNSLNLDEIRDIIKILLVDCPYEFYWVDQYDQWPIMSDNKSYKQVTVKIGATYDAGSHTINTSLTSSASLAADKARSIIEKYADKSNYEKLVGYRNEICNLVSYNNDAADDDNWNNTHPGVWDPWHLIWVFDGDPSTNVVCEGYARAFQYLCDNTAFNGNVVCLYVGGVIQYGKGYSLADSEPHAWNIVQMHNGKNYLVDITWCDNENGEPYDFLFMRGGGSDLGNPRLFWQRGSSFYGAKYIANTWDTNHYTPEELSISNNDYQKEAEPDPKPNPEPDVELNPDPDNHDSGSSGSEYPSDPSETTSDGNNSQQGVESGTSQTVSQPAPAPAPAAVAAPAAPVDNITIAKAPASVKAKAAKNGKVTVSWKKIKKTKKTKALLNQIKGIEVQYSTDPDFITDVNTKTLGKKKTKATITGLQKSTIYYVRVRYTDGAGGVSNWSAVKKVKTKKK